MATPKNKSKLDVLTLWCLSQDGVPEEKIAFCDAVYSFKNEKYGFITEFDRTKNELLKAINDSAPYLDYIYVFTESSKKQELINLLPNNIGILSNCNEYGLGSMIGIQRPAIKF